MAQGPTITPRRILEGEFDRSSARQKAEVAREVILRSSLGAAALALEPVPFLDTAIVTPMQHHLVQSIGRLHGYRLESKDVEAIFEVIRGGLYAPNAMIALAKVIVFVPVVPDLIAGTIAFALTSAVGKLGDRIFATGRTMSPSEMRTCFRTLFRGEFTHAYKERRDELKAMFRSPQVRRELEDLKRARQRGDVGPDELPRKTAEILDRSGHR